MSDLRSFINLIIKQTCRDFAYEYERGWRNSTEEYTTTYKYTLEYLRLLYENPDKYINEIIGVPSTDSSSEVVNTKEFTDNEKQKLLIFFKNVNSMKPRCSRLWVDLQHYMLYVYRNVVTCNPNPVEERLSKRIRSNMRKIVVELTKEDKCQLYLRLFALLREYVIFAHWHFNKITDKNMCLPRLFHYYEAFLIAADSLRRVFKDFEITLKMNYRLNWVDFNMCIFMHYFYELNDVQTKLYDFKVNDSTSFKTVDMYNLLRTRFSDLHGRWFTKKLGVKAHNKETEIVDEGHSQNENGILIEVQNILSQNFWIQRSPEKRALFNTATMESQVFWLLGDTILKISEPNLDKTGQCICEYCLITKYKYVLGQNQHIPSNRQIPCQICETTVILDNLQQHMNEHENVNDSTESDDSTEQFSNLNGELLNSAFMNEIKSLLDNSSKKALANINQKKELTNGEVPTDKPDWQLEHFFGFSNEEKENIENSHQDMSDIPTYNDFLTFQIALDNHIKNKKEGKANDALDALYFQEFLKHSMYIGQNWPENAKANPVVDKKPSEPSPKIFAKPTPLPVEQGVQTVQKEVEKKPEVEQVKSPVPSVQPPASLQPKPPATLPCGHSCKHGEEVKSDLKKVCQGICDHHSKDAKKCDCTYCEVFGTSKTQINPKDNVTRNRLRIRLLNQRKAKSKLATTETATTSQAVTEPTTTDLVSTQPSINLVESTLYSKTNPIVNGKNVTGKKKKGVPEDLKDQLHYIEGEQRSHAAEKKAAKKARQRLKKEEERLKKEEEQRKKEEEEAKLRAAQLAKESAEQERESKKDKKKKAKNQQQTATSESANLAVYEETIPALVTIKRSHESDTLLTIKFQDRTRNQDELLSSLVRQTNNSNNNIDSNHNTHSNTGQQQNESKKVKKNKQQQQNVLAEKNIAETNDSKKKKKKSVNEKNEKQDSSSVIANEVKITLSIPSQSFSSTSLGQSNKHGHSNMQVSSKAAPSRIASSSSNSEKQQNVNSKDSKKNKQKNQPKENEQKSVASSKKTGKDDSKNKENQTCELTNLRLPPGITITKVNGPVSNRNYKSTDLQNVQQNSSNTTSIPVSKSGVIVVDTEKLIQQTSPPATNNATEPSRKSRKKKNRKQQAPNGNTNGTQSGQEIVTLKNPYFNTLHSSKPEAEKVPDMSQGQASIITNENGMVTIRSSRLQHSLNNGTPMPNLLSELKPVIGPDVATPYVPPSSFPEPNRISPFNAQEILSGLPGIEITKVDKCSTKSDNDIRKSCQTAEVSIIPANGAEKFCMEKEDWHYDSVFTPKDILEDDMDAEERELEAFKRFCQQSVPPERKEKVAHLNVKDIVLKKKNDINSV